MRLTPSIDPYRDEESNAGYIALSDRLLREMIQSGMLDDTLCILGDNYKKVVRMFFDNDIVRTVATKKQACYIATDATRASRPTHSTIHACWRSAIIARLRYPKTVRPRPALAWWEGIWIFLPTYSNCIRDFLIRNKRSLTVNFLCIQYNNLQLCMSSLSCESHEVRESSTRTQVFLSSDKSFYFCA